MKNYNYAQRLDKYTLFQKIVKIESQVVEKMSACWETTLKRYYLLNEKLNTTLMWIQLMWKKIYIFLFFNRELQYLN